MFMRNANRLAALTAFFTGLWCTAAASAVSLAPEPWLPLCTDEVVYGTATVDRSLRAFALRGTAYVFVVSEDVSLDDLDGQRVRIEIAPDCSIRDLRVIGANDDAVL